MLSPDRVIGTWRTYVTGTGKDGVWLLQVTRSSARLHAPSARPGAFQDAGLMSTGRGTMTFGPSAECPSGSQLGSYTWTFAGGGRVLDLALVSDDCAARAAVLAQSGWLRGATEATGAAPTPTGTP
jgi:hypothetical protein